jgi:ABC-type polysaccharide/polyol phosphate export permease/Tfp pilus assembly protein PilF
LTEDPDLQALAAETAAAAASQPGNIHLLLHAATSALRAGDVTSAVSFARDAMRVEPGNFRVLRTLSGILNAVGQRAEAIHIGLGAAQIDPANAELRLHLGGLFTAERRWREAAEHLSIHVASSAATSQGWRLLSSVLHQAGDTEAGTEAARNAIAADPNNIEYRLNLASLLSARALYDDALDELATALAQAPDNATVWRTKSSVHAALGQLSEALRAAQRSVELDADDPTARAQLDEVNRLCTLPAPNRQPVGTVAQWSVNKRRHPQRPQQSPTLADDVALRWRVIYAIILRDMRTKFGHTRLGYLWAIMEPMSHLLTLGSVFYVLNHSPPPVGDNMFLFYITGLVPFLMFSHVSQDVMDASEASSNLLQLPVVRRTDVMIARALRQFATELVVGIVIFSIAALLGERGLPNDLLRAGAAVTLLWLLAIGIGAVNMIICEMFPSYHTLYAAIIRLLYFSSGIYYSPIEMPDWVRDLLVWNPILQGIDMFRSGFYPQYQPHWLDVSYLTIWVVASIGTGFMLERAMRGRMVVHT